MINPFTVNIGITVNLGEPTINALGVLFRGMSAPKATARPEPAKANPEPVKPEAPKPAPAKEEKKPESISDETIRAAVKATVARKVPSSAIKELFNEFGISSSPECPQERRQELIDRLNSLAA